MSASNVDRENAVRILESGGILLMETDTLPGFHCRADRPAAVNRILGLKGRQEGKPLLVLAGSSEQAAQVSGPLDSNQEALCAACWPGPFSIILAANQQLDVGVTGGRDTVAVRVPGLDVLRDLILAAGFPLVSTSANMAGQEPSLSLSEAADRFAHLTDGVVSPLVPGPGNGAKISPHGPSALVDATVWPPVILRAGPLALPPLDYGSDHTSGHTPDHRS